MANQRIARTEKWIRIEISKILKTKVKNPKLHNITITDVKLTNDLSYATIKWHIFYEDKSEISNITNDLEIVKGFCRKELAQISSGYKVPQLIFKYDNTIDKAQKIEEILNKIKN